MIGQHDTIAAIATPSGTGGVCIIRISGAQALAIAKQLSKIEDVRKRHVHFAHFYAQDGSLIDQGILLYFQAPHSFTGEDVVELQGHGGIAVANALLGAALDSGARLAEAGEFTRRAFLNDKLDLSQAEAVADLIAARSMAAMQAANRSLQGEFSRQVNSLADEILQLRVYIEAALDFPEEEIDFISEGNIEARLLAWGEKLSALLQQSEQGKLLNEGIDLVLAGKPNAGKSSLLNALSGEDRAIVTHIAGTTRDILRESIIIEGIPINLVDTAGLRESEDIVEQEGIRRSHQAIQHAQLIALLIAADDMDAAEILDLETQLHERAGNSPIVKLYNKADLADASLQAQYQDGLWLSAKTGQGLEAVRKKIAQLAGKTESEAPFIARERHIRALDKAQRHFLQAWQAFQGHRAAELLAQDLRLVHDDLGEITGKVHADDLLGEIFSGFCIGK